MREKHQAQKEDHVKNWDNTIKIKRGIGNNNNWERSIKSNISKREVLTSRARNLKLPLPWDHSQHRTTITMGPLKRSTCSQHESTKGLTPHNIDHPKYQKFTTWSKRIKIETQLRWWSRALSNFRKEMKKRERIEFKRR